MAFRIVVIPTHHDSRAVNLQHKIGIADNVVLHDVYTVSSDIADKSKLADSLTDKILAKNIIEDDTKSSFQQYQAMLPDYDYAVEIGFLPGVTDNVGHTATEIAADLLDGDAPTIYSSKLLYIKGEIDLDEMKKKVANQLIERIHIKDKAQFIADNGMDIIIPEVHLQGAQTSDLIDLDVSDAELKLIGEQGIANADGTRRGPLGLSLDYMKAIAAYFKSLGRKAYDIELETLAQTWSEHCKHTIFASQIDGIEDGLYKHYIKRATFEIREKMGENDICVSVFSDNAGAIILNEGYLITDKVETHNSPSALDPFGGAITGIVGVNRDCVGFGMGAKPVANRYGYCFADPESSPKLYRDKNLTDPMLSPRTIMDGVIEGVNVGGNCSGIPTTQGFAYFDAGYSGKPLVFVGTVGLIPRELNGKSSCEKQAKPEDHIVMIGGRVGRDGIHGATFSSVALDEGSPATAVQIGDPITQKKMSDAIIKELRDMGLYTAITDNGAGGLSSSVGEMAEQSGGFHVELDKVPLKYPGMSPWEIWISESQERMTMAVPEQNLQQVIAFLESRGVEATSIGRYKDDGKAKITFNGDVIMDLDMEFLHDGLPEKKLVTEYQHPEIKSFEPPELDDYSDILLDLISNLNICGKSFIANQYDHHVQGNTVLGPLQGSGQIYAENSVIKPVPDADECAVLSHGLNPRQSELDCYHMAANSIDIAVRNAIAAGGSLDHLAILDNFCWCSSDDPHRLAQLKRACEACYDYATAYGTPFISGKDSMFNDFKGYDENGEAIKISAPPTLLVSALGVVKKTENVTSLDVKGAGDLIYVIGKTRKALGASEYYNLYGELGENIPIVDAESNIPHYNALSKSIASGYIKSAIAVNYGGIAIALSKALIGGGFGADIDLDNAPSDDSVNRADHILFSETPGRFIVSVSGDNQHNFENIFAGLDLGLLGSVSEFTNITAKYKGNIVIDQQLDVLEASYKNKMAGY